MQKVLEDAISLKLKEEIVVKAAGRTDSGVHALGMVASFQSKNEIENLQLFLISVNGIIIQTTAAVTAIKKMPEEFHARFSCTEREYEYWIANSRFRHPLLIGRSHWVKTRLDLELIESNIQYLLGQHFFASFTPPATLMGKSSKREISELRIIRSDEYSGLLKFRIRGTGFLHNMVRITVGTLIDIGRGRINNRNMREIIEARDREQAGITLPPDGLYFIRAYYEKFPEIDELYFQNRF